VSFGSDEPSHLRDRVAYARHVLLVGSLALLAALALTPALATAAEDTNRTSVDFSLYFLGSSMTGDVAIGNVNADLNTSFSDVMEHLEFGAMGFGRVARDPWSFTTEVVYMGLGASKDVVSSNFEQWVVEPRVGYRVSSRLEVDALNRGFRLESEEPGGGRSVIAIDIDERGRVSRGYLPFWDGDTVHGESVLFIQDENATQAKAAVLVASLLAAGLAAVLLRARARAR